MPASHWDAVVIGGGITGAGVLRDLALRGARAILVEKAEPGRATTAASSHLIHGGLRYLLYDRLTTHTSCWDAGHIVRLARPLLTRLPILWPVYRDHRRGRETVETLLESYDRFQPLKEGKKHLRLSARETRRLVPGLKETGLLGGLLFDEYWVDPVALVEANLHAALEAGASRRLGTEVVGFEASPETAPDQVGVRCRSQRGEETLWASVAINATGPWADRVAAQAGEKVSLRLQKGSHLVFNETPELLRGALRPVGLLLEAIDRDRYVFILPGQEKTLVGPTDLAESGDPDHLTTTAEEVRYLVDSCRRFFPTFPEQNDGTTVGARPVVGQSGSETLLSRGFRVIDHGGRRGGSRLISVLGGKMSDFRLMAEEAADRAGPGWKNPSPSRTADVALDGRPIRTQGPVGRPPWKPWVSFLNRSPRLREFHAWAHLGWAFGRHTMRRMFAPPHESTAEDVVTHYSSDH